MIEVHHKILAVQENNRSRSSVTVLAKKKQQNSKKMHQNEFQVTEELRPTLSVKLQCIKENVREDDAQILK